MSGSSNEYYFSSKAAKGSKSAKRDDGNRGQEQDLPRLRDVLREQFDDSYDPAYNLQGMGRALPQQSCHSSHPSLRLPPIRESSLSSTKQEDYEYSLSQTTSTSRTQHSSRPTPKDQPTYHVLAPSSAGGKLVPVSTSHTKPPGIVRGHVLTAGMHGDDSRKRFECHVCGRRMERQSVYNQHMLTHTDERPHVCSYCPKSFNSKSNLNRHMLTHSNRWNDDEDQTNGYDKGSSSKLYYSSTRRA